MNIRNENKIVAAIQSEWASAFRRGDFQALCLLYAPEAQLFGGKPDLYAGANRVRDYFAAVPAGVKVVFDDTNVVLASPTTILAAGFATFSLGDQQGVHRLSWTLLDNGARWVIASHHASETPA
ncbi:MAG: nuclear transport factor 2 family protein [Sulfuricaulis sp.]|nr:nuclear transport factor 2 family protein [Sulfuricaulis sp.]